VKRRYNQTAWRITTGGNWWRAYKIGGIGVGYCHCPKPATGSRDNVLSAAFTESRSEPGRSTGPPLRDVGAERWNVPRRTVA
jgi:hypothetical protein